MTTDCYFNLYAPAGMRALELKLAVVVIPIAVAMGIPDRFMDLAMGVSHGIPHFLAGLPESIVSFALGILEAVVNFAPGVFHVSMRFALRLMHIVTSIAHFAMAARGQQTNQGHGRNNFPSPHKNPVT